MTIRHLKCFLLLLSSFLLMSCATLQHARYSVNTSSYQVLRSSKDYNMNGVASWYGRSKHRRRTSSGEWYNRYALTAAHKTLPLFTRVQVTNLRNGKTVIVTINDRGPFAGKRLIDLSYAAAKKIGMLGRGTVDVNVKALA